MNLQIKKLLVSSMIIGAVTGILFTNKITNNESIYLGVANNIEKTLSIDINDFYYNTTIDTKFTTGSTNGETLTANTDSTCEIPVSGRLGHTSGDISGGFRLNATVITANGGLHLRINLGNKKLTGISGYVYTDAVRSLRINKNSTPGVSSYTTNSSTFTVVGTNWNSTTFNTVTFIDKVDVVGDFTGEIEIHASGSLGFTEIILHYTE
jgi:hypothetical protein